MISYSGDKFAGWKGDMLAGGRSGQRLVRMTLNGHRVVADEILIQGMGRMRDVQQGPDGSTYVAIDADVRGVDGEGTPVYKLVPLERASTATQR